MLQKTIDIQNLSSKRLKTALLKRKITRLQHALEQLPAHEKTRCFFTSLATSSEENMAAEDEEPPSQYRFVSPSDTIEHTLRIVFVDRQEMQLLQREKGISKQKPSASHDAKDNYTQNIAHGNEKRVEYSTPDILSWNDEDSYSHPVSGCGDIAICLCEVFANARRDDLPFSYCLLEILLHGMWHLYGMRHDYENDSLIALANAQQKMLSEWKLWGNVQVEKEAMELIS